MKMSVREARANFASALDAAERGEHVTITKNGKAIAEMGPPSGQKLDWDALEQFRKERGWDKLQPDEVWPPEFDDPAFSRQVLGIGEDWDPTR